MTNQDVGSAVDFLIEEKAKRLQKREEDMKRRQEIECVLYCPYILSTYACKFLWVA